MATSAKDPKTRIALTLKILCSSFSLLLPQTHHKFYSGQFPRIIPAELMFLILLLNCVNTITTTTVDRSSPVTKFVLLARQRGGSHYTVSLIDQDPSCVVTGELVSVEDAVSNNFTASSKWTQKIEEYYERTVPVGGVGAVGFILHHNQVCPTQDVFIECMVEFGSWVAARKIRVLHLVREAALMMVSSDYVQSLDVDHVSSTTNQTRASESHAFASRHLMPLTKESLRRLRKVYEESKLSSANSQKRIEFSNAKTITIFATSRSSTAVSGRLLSKSHFSFFIQVLPLPRSSSC